MKPTPEKNNAAAPSFSVPAGFYPEDFFVELESADGYEIYYTVDGSDPTIESNRYTEPVRVYNRSEEADLYKNLPNFTYDWLKEEISDTSSPKGTVLRAVAVGPEGQISDISNASYFIDMEVYSERAVVSLIASPDDLFGPNGIYSTGEAYDNWYLNGAEGEAPLANFDIHATSEITLRVVLLCVLCTTIISVFVYWIYRLINKNSFYNKGFNLSLIVLAVITSAIILTIQSNIVVSLGMVGALSIVRFRTAIKVPMDLVFLLWSISIEIICGAGFALIAAVASLVIAIIIACVMVSSTSKSSSVLVINATAFEHEKEILQIIRAHCKYMKIRARNVSQSSLNLAVEIKAPDESLLIEGLIAMPYVSNASIVEHDGQITA